MVPDSERPGVFRFAGGVLGPRRQEKFTVLVDGDPGLAFYPEAPGSCPPGESIVRGPGKVDEDRCFLLASLKANAAFEIVLDLTAADKRRTVDVKWPSGRVDHGSMKDTFLHFFRAA
ncbi:unnamed protein product [Polarella glacialis]|uniref:Uncharacterized protein n=1 Tax=Polarella glacialis TaxID=89957 RepID=A0A813FSK4_POLGL|nr:unnamed protein product [Polarella glacialis]